MEKYIGTKIVQAEPAWRVTELGDVYRIVPKAEFVEPDAPHALEDGYKVIYEDGYESWSPADTFNQAYRMTTAMNFGLALEAAKQGKKISRKEWGGMIHVFLEGEEFCINSVNEIIQFAGLPWMPDSTDLLADDWYILEDE